jgi:hypothetical protein
VKTLKNARHEELIDFIDQVAPRLFIFLTVFGLPAGLLLLHIFCFI